MVTGHDFRAAQCEDHNGFPLDGVSYQWKPYYGRKYGEIYILVCILIMCIWMVTKDGPQLHLKKPSISGFYDNIWLN